MFLKKVFVLLFVITPTLFVCAEKDISIIYGKASLINKSSEAYVRRRGDALDRRLISSGFSTICVSDEKISEAFSKNIKVSHLVCVERPSEDFLKALEMFLSRGGKIVVHQSDSKKLAKIMGINIGGFVSTREGWDNIGFNEKKWLRPLHMPEELNQSCSKVLEIGLKDKKGKVLAYWRKGDKKGPVACIKTSKGIWCNYLLSEELDLNIRRAYVSSITCALEVGLWRGVSKNLEREINESLQKEGGLEKLCNNVIKRVDEKKQGVALELITKIKSLHNEISSNAKKGLFGAASALQWNLRDSLVSVEALCNPIKKPNVVGAWDKNLDILKYDDIDGYVNQLCDAGVTDVYISMASPVWSRVSMRSVVSGTSLTISDDVLKKIIEAYHKKGVNVHAWIYTLSCENASKKAVDTLSKKGMLLRNSDETPSVVWLNPAKGETIVLLNNIVSELLARFDFDGVHLDYIRYPFLYGLVGTDWDKKRFEHDMAIKVTGWPKSAWVGGEHRKKFDKWRSANIKRVVSKVGNTVKSLNSKLIFSVAVYGKHPACVGSIGQDWFDWEKLGVVDYFVAMNYTGNMDFYKELLANQTKNISKRKLLSGLGVTSYEADLKYHEVKEQIKEANKRGLSGVVFFDLDEYLRREVLSSLIYSFE